MDSVSGVQFLAHGLELTLETLIRHQEVAGATLNRFDRASARFGRDLEDAMDYELSRVLETRHDRTTAGGSRRGVGPVYGSRLRRIGIGTLAELRRATIADIASVAGGGRRRARSWKGQAWLMAAGMPRHAAEVIVASGIACTLRELIGADPDDIVDAVRRAQRDPESRRNRIPDKEAHLH